MNPRESVSIQERDHSVHGLFVKEFAPKGTDRRGAPIVMVHGGSHGWWAFEQWQLFFAEKGWTTYALSVRNYTDSYSVPFSEYVRLKVSDYVDDVLTVVEWIGESPVLLGHSMGGIVVQKASERVKPQALVLVAPVAPGSMGVLRGPLPPDKTVLPSREDVRRLWFRAIDDKTLLSVYERLVPESPLTWRPFISQSLSWAAKTTFPGCRRPRPWVSSSGRITFFCRIAATRSCWSPGRSKPPNL